MKIHEYQAKAILAQYHVPVPRGEVAFTVEEAEAAAKKEAESRSPGTPPRPPPSRIRCWA